ncbi:extracellular solute-binding protein [Lachnotalea sp. AF33-28]|uniref:extracellular solute-binding protein n=1 Tax=Lachnotalea sp. AF33-28 TaxID=2292046 RepID=UPI000E4E760A|nr:extracellular solute-binding protein [Lachnotalea sp. AF33-28]RHP36499.1 extracellular solute-binding protein [Lachnotalea sp. AF33-28]
MKNVNIRRKRSNKEKNGFWSRWISVILCLTLLMGTLTGCEEEKPEEKTVVTIMYSNSFDHLKKLIEGTYPDISLEYEHLSYPSEQLRRVEKGAGPDIVVLPQPSSEIAEKYLLDIGDMQASTAYDGTVMRQLQVDGTTYFLPLPGQYSGYIVNETLFQKAGISIPESRQELLDALVEMKKQGIGVGEDGINFTISSDFNSWLGMYYVGYMVPDFLGTVKGDAWLAGLRKKEETFAGVWDSMLDFTDQLIDAGVMDAASMGKQRNLILYRSRMSDGSLAAVFGDSALYQQCVAKNRANVQAGTAPEYSYRMLPLLSDEGNTPWLLLAPSAYIAVNAAADEKKQEAAKKILDLLSTPEGQEAVMEDLKMGVSYLRDYQSKEAFVPKGLEEYAQAGYVYHVQFPDRTIEYLGSQVRQVLAGKITLQEALETVDRYHYEGSEAVDYDLSVVGTLEHDMLFQNYNVRLGETEIGNLLADSVAEASDAPIAVVNGGGIRGSLYQGEVYGEDLLAVCPYDNTITVLEMSGQVLWDMLENGLSKITRDDIPGGRFLQVSGICYTYDSSKPVGQRLAEVKLVDGTALDTEGTYQVAVNNYMAGSQGYAEGNGDGYEMLNCYDEQTPKGEVTLIRDMDLTYRDALALYFANRQGVPVHKELEGRIVDLSGQGQ